MKTRGVAVLGCGTIGQTHIRAVREIDGLRLVGVSARRAEKARETAEREECLGTADYRELLGHPEVDLVTITTSSGSHGRIALEALEAGKHVLVEKPMAMTAEEAARVVASAREKGLTLSVVSQRRFEDQHQAVKRVVAEGALGRLLLVEVSCPYYRTQEYYDSADWRGKAAQDGGALMNQGIHSVDLMLWLAGPARSVSGLAATQTHRIEAEDLALAIVSFEGGAFGTIMASTSIQPGFSPALNLYGEKGTIKLEGAAIAHWTVPGIDRPEPAPQAASAGVRDPKLASHRHHLLQIEDVLQAIEHGRPPAVPGEDGWRAVQLVEGVYRSAASGVAVRLAAP